MERKLIDKMSWQRTKQFEGNIKPNSLSFKKQNEAQKQLQSKDFLTQGYQNHLYA